MQYCFFSPFGFFRCDVTTKPVMSLTNPLFGFFLREAGGDSKVVKPKGFASRPSGRPPTDDSANQPSAPSFPKEKASPGITPKRKLPPRQDGGRKGKEGKNVHAVTQPSKGFLGEGRLPGQGLAPRGQEGTPLTQPQAYSLRSPAREHCRLRSHPRQRRQTARVHSRSLRRRSGPESRSVQQLPAPLRHSPFLCAGQM